MPALGSEPVTWLVLFSILYPAVSTGPGIEWALGSQVLDTSQAPSIPTPSISILRN